MIYEDRLSYGLISTTIRMKRNIFQDMLLAALMDGRHSHSRSHSRYLKRFAERTSRKDLKTHVTHVTCILSGDPVWHAPKSYPLSKAERDLASEISVSRKEFSCANDACLMVSSSRAMTAQNCRKRFHSEVSKRKTGDLFSLNRFPGWLEVRAQISTPLCRMSPSMFADQTWTAQEADVFVPSKRALSNTLPILSLCCGPSSISAAC